MIAKWISEGHFTQDEYEDGLDDCLTRLGFNSEEAGSCWSGEIVRYIMIEGQNLTEILKNEESFVNKLKEMG